MTNGQTVASTPHDGNASSPDWKRFRNPSLPVVALGPDGCIEHLSNAARRLLELGPDQTVERSFFSLIHGKQLYPVMRDVADMVCHGKMQANWLLRLRTATGRWKWFKADVFNQISTPGAVVCIVLHAV